MFDVQMQQSGIPRFLVLPELLVVDCAATEAVAGRVRAFIFLKAFVLEVGLDGVLLRRIKANLKAFTPACHSLPISTLIFTLL